MRNASHLPAIYLEISELTELASCFCSLCFYLISITAHLLEGWAQKLFRCSNSKHFKCQNAPMWFTKQMLGCLAACLDGTQGRFSDISGTAIGPKGLVYVPRGLQDFVYKGQRNSVVYQTCPCSTLRENMLLWALVTLCAYWALISGIVGHTANISCRCCRFCFYFLDFAL